MRQQASVAQPYATNALGECSRCGLFVLNNGLICGETILSKMCSPHFSDCRPSHMPATSSSPASLGAAAMSSVRGELPVASASAGACACPPLPGAAEAMRAAGAPNAASPRFPLGTIPGLRHIYRREGLAGIYAGLSPTLVMAVPATVLYFTAYDSLKPALEQAGVGVDLAPPAAGMAARVLASVATSPFELVRTLMQSELGGHGPGAVGGGGTIASFRGIVRSGGVLALWRGLEPTLWRDIPFSAIYWFVLERGKRSLRDRDRAAGLPPPSATTEAMRSFACGAIAGIFAATSTTPFDVVKTRRQVFAAMADSSSERAATVGMDQRLSSGNGSTPQVLRAIWREEGLRGIFRGNTARILKIAPACAIMISSYETGKRAFGVID